MGKQMTEILKGTLEGIVLAVLSGRPAYGYEITAWLREQGFSDIAEGTVYALLVRIEQRGLVDVEKVPSEKGPPRKVYSLNAQGQAYLEEFWRTWSFLSEREPVADAGIGTDVAPLAARGLDLAAQVGDVGAQRRRVVGVGRAPHLAQQRAMSHQPPAVAREHAQQLELDRRQVDLLAVAVNAWAATSISSPSARSTGSSGVGAARRSAASRRATSSREPNGFVT